MRPSVVAKTMFCDGTSNSAAAAWMSAASSATFIASTASMRPARLRRGPAEGDLEPPAGRVLGDRGGADAHEVEHVGHQRAVHGLADGETDVVAPVHVDDLGRSVIGDAHAVQPGWCRLVDLLRKKSVTSAPRSVSPHASVALWPMTTPGSPANANPETS